MRRFGLAGWSGSGKTALITRLIPLIAARGLTVSTVKHAHHSFDTDQPGKDSFEHRAAGATEVCVSSENRWALVHENRGAPEAALDALIARMSPVDLVLIEGYKALPHDKLEVHRPSLGQPLLAANDPHIVAVASDAPVAGLAVPVLALDDAAAITDFILAHCGLGAVDGPTVG